MLSILLLVFAVAALAGPSFTLGLGLNGIAHAHSTATVVSDGEPITVWSCKSLGGKRVMPCHPDLGVLSGLLREAEPPAPVALSRAVRLPVPTRFPEAELPPPRHG